MRFEFFPLRFEFTALGTLSFPPGMAANTLRGALGVIFRSIACAPQCPGAGECEARDSCAYAKLFEPAAYGSGPSGLADWPRPFVFRARHLDGQTIRPGQPFHFDLNVFALDPAALGYFIVTFAALAREGLGAGRGKAELRRVRSMPVSTTPEQLVFDGAKGDDAAKSQPLTEVVEPASLDLAPPVDAPPKICVEFLTPTELKHERQVAQRPDFHILFGRVRDRISTLRRLYGPGPLEIDYRATATRAAEVKMTHFEMRREDNFRRSTRTGQSHSIGGFVGMAEYEGELAEFIPYLNAGRWTGVGRHAVWGQGEINLISRYPIS